MGFPVFQCLNIILTIESIIRAFGKFVKNFFSVSVQIYSSAFSDFKNTQSCACWGVSARGMRMSLITAPMPAPGPGRCQLFFAIIFCALLPLTTPGGYEILDGFFRNTAREKIVKNYQINSFTFPRLFEIIRSWIGGWAPDQNKGDNYMSNYSDSMVKALTSQNAWTFAQAVQFAEANNLSTRSVVSKIKSLDLGYTPKPKAASKVRFVKADTVLAIAKALDADSDELAGLAKADANSLSALLMAIR